MPIVGPVFKKAALSRFASIFAILQTSGVPIMQSLTILSATMGNEALTRAFDNVRERIKERRRNCHSVKIGKILYADGY